MTPESEKELREKLTAICEARLLTGIDPPNILPSPMLKAELAQLGPEGRRKYLDMRSDEIIEELVNSYPSGTPIHWGDKIIRLAKHAEDCDCCTARRASEASNG